MVLDLLLHKQLHRHKAMAGMGNARHLETGSTRPAPPSKDVLRVYGMKFCPYVHRLKLVLAAKGVKHETININLIKKPEWYFDINPLGKVPSIEINGKILYESDITSDYVDAAYPGRKLTTEDPFHRAEERIVLSHFGEATSAFYGYLRAKDEEAKAENLKKAKSGLSRVASFLEKGNSFVGGGEKPGMVDYMIWPHLERLGLFLSSVVTENQTLQAYFDRMGKDEAVIACRHPNELMLQFAEPFSKGEMSKMVYDIGTVE